MSKSNTEYRWARRANAIQRAKASRKLVRKQAIASRGPYTPHGDIHDHKRSCARRVRQAASRSGEVA